MKNLYILNLILMFLLSSCVSKESSPLKNDKDNWRSTSVLTGTLVNETTNEELQVPYVCENGISVMGGDVELPWSCDEVSSEVREENFPDSNTQGYFLSGSYGLWPNATIPYEIDPRIDYADSLLQEMKKLSFLTPIKFVPRTNERDYIAFVPMSDRDENFAGCRATLGRVGGKQFVWLNGSWCAIHEIGHAIGMPHEHQRPDRDQFVKILPAYQSDSNFLVFSGGQSLGPYDIDSVMHYDMRFFSALDDSQLNQIPGLSRGDIQAITQMYGPLAPPRIEEKHILLARQLIASLDNGECRVNLRDVSDVGELNRYTLKVRFKKQQGIARDLEVELFSDISEEQAGKIVKNSLSRLVDSCAGS